MNFTQPTICNIPATFVDIGSPFLPKISGYVIEICTPRYNGDRDVIRFQFAQGGVVRTCATCIKFQ